MAKSFLSEFASRLKVDINAGEGGGPRGMREQASNQPEAGVGISQGGPGDQSHM